MADPFVAEIRVVGFNFSPIGWAFCNGQLLPIDQNTALFSLLGTTYGGDGRSTFALPDVQGQAVVGQGLSTTGSQYLEGEQRGEQAVTLLSSEIPPHTHRVAASTDPGEGVNPDQNQSLSRSAPGNAWTDQTSSATVLMDLRSTVIAGSSFPHNNMQPYLALNYIIALQGVFPQRP